MFIKSVVASTPNYLMQFIPFTKGCCNELDKISHSFLWGFSLDSRKILLLSWDAICKPKQLLGFNALLI